MAKYQRNLALSLVRTQGAKLLPESSTLGTLPEASITAPAATILSTHPSPTAAPPLLRDEIDGLRGGTTREGRRLEDWHPESLVALWCTSLIADAGKRSDKGDDDGGGWARGRERTLAVLRWASKDAEPEAGGVMAGTVVPFLAHGTSLGERASGKEGNGLEKLKACFAAYASERMDDEAPDDDEEAGGRRKYSSAPSVRRLPHASVRHFVQNDDGDATPSSARHIADTAAAAGVPRRLLNLSGAELSALSALLDEALGQNLPSASVSATEKPAAASGDTAAALFSSSRPLSSQSSSSSGLGELKGSGLPAAPPIPAEMTTQYTDDSANVFMLAHGLRTRLGKGGKVAAVPGGASVVASATDGAIETGIASSAALGMLLSGTKTQNEVLEVLCPKVEAGFGGAAKGLTWTDAKALLLPFWVQDVSELQRVTEVVAANTFREDRNLMAVRLSFKAVLV